MARDRRNRPRKDKLARPKKKGLRERRQKHRQLQSAAIDLIAKQARLSHDGVAVGYNWHTDHDDVTRRYQRACCTAEGLIEQMGRWKPPVPPLHVTPTVLEQAADGETLGGCFDTPPLPSQIGGREGYWEGRVVRRWKKIKQRHLEELLDYEWEPARPKSAIDALGDLARGQE